VEQGKYVFDTSALFCYIENEDGADVIESILDQAEEGGADIFVPFVCYTEVFYITLQEKGRDIAKERLELIESLPLHRVESDKDLSLAAGEMKASKRLSFADCWVAAVAKRKDATLVHKDPEFEQLSGEIKMLGLPYKK
jgi:predicted nucleic acid-binding protein